MRVVTSIGGKIEQSGIMNSRREPCSKSRGHLWVVVGHASKSPEVVIKDQVILNFATFYPSVSHEKTCSLGHE
jgi:hypothetical protein